MWLASQCWGLVGGLSYSSCGPLYTTRQSCNVSSDLAFTVTHCHCHNILLVMQVTLFNAGSTQGHRNQVTRITGDHFRGCCHRHQGTLRTHDSKIKRRSYKEHETQRSIFCKARCGRLLQKWPLRIHIFPNPWPRIAPSHIDSEFGHATCFD